VDVQLSWCEPLDVMQERIERLRGMAAEHDRELAFGLRVHAISRDTADEAWNETDRLVAAMNPETLKFMVEAQKSSASEGQRRMAALHKGSTDDLVVGKNLWAGVGLVRAGAGTALVGSHEEIADRLSEFHDVGITHVILSGHPHLEEAYTVGEGLLPVLRERGLVASPQDAAVA
jgi:alkanesulfonate monooxygenase